MALMTYIFRDLSLHGMKERLRNIPLVLESAGRAVAGIVPLIVCANIVLVLLDYTGVGLKFSSLIMSLGQEQLILSLLLAAILVMVLGCVLPTTAVYILGVVTAVPLLTGLGIAPIAAHLFILYYAELAVITPPVCSVIFVAAAIAQSNWLKTAWVALKLAPLLYLVPFLFVFDSTFLMIGSPWAILLNVGTVVIGAIVLVSGTMGQLLTKCNILERLALVTSGVLLALPGWQTDLLGGALVSAILAKQVWQMKKVVKVMD